MDNKESLCSIPKTGIAESPQKNRQNKRNSNGCFSKLRKVGHKQKSLHPMRKGLAARRRLVFSAVQTPVLSPPAPAPAPAKKTPATGKKNSLQFKLETPSLFFI